MPLLLSLALAAALVQPGSASTIVLSGRVLEADTGAPIAGAQVVAFPSEPRHSMQAPPTATTDANGRYQFDTLSSGRYHITVHKPGFAPLDRPQLEVEVKEGARHADVDVRLQKGAVITGRVLDESGEPVVSANVMILRRPRHAAVAARGDRLIPGGPSAQTNDLGEFRLFGLAPGDYYVGVVADSPFRVAPAQRDTASQLTYFPGTADRAAAQPITVAAGQTVGDIIIRMVTAPVFRVEGVAVDEEGRPVSNAVVRLDTGEVDERVMFMMSHQQQARTDAAGRFAVPNVTSGTYTLVVIPGRVISSPLIAQGGGSSGRSMSFGSSLGVGGTVSGSVMTETSGDGTTVEYRDDAATRVPITISDGHVTGIEIVVHRRPR